MKKIVTTLLLTLLPISAYSMKYDFRKSQMTHYTNVESLIKEIKANKNNREIEYNRDGNTEWFIIRWIEEYEINTSND